MNISSTALKHVVVLARALNFTQAAEELGMTQSALTRSIQAIERRVNQQLFDRKRGGVVHLTPMGQRLVLRAAPLLAELDEVAQMLTRSSTPHDGDLTFGADPLLARALLSNLFTEQATLDPPRQINLAVRGTDALLALLAEKKIEFCICPVQRLAPQLAIRSDILGWCPLSILVRPDHPLLHRRHEPQDWVYPVISSGHGKDLQALAAVMGPYISRPANILIEDIEMLSRITQTSDAVWFTSSLAAAAEMREGKLQEVILPPGRLPRRFRAMMYSLHGHALSPTAQRLKKQIQDEIRALTTVVQG